MFNINVFIHYTYNYYYYIICVITVYNVIINSYNFIISDMQEIRLFKTIIYNGIMTNNNYNTEWYVLRHYFFFTIDEDFVE